MVKTGQVWTGNFTTEDATGALATPSVGPAGVLYVAGVATADVVTISTAATGNYKFSVTLPALTAGQSVAMYITATISTIAKGIFVAQDIGDTSRVSDVIIDTTTILARLGTFTGTGINTVLGFLRALGAKAGALTPTDLSSGTTYDNTTDSQEAIKDALPAAAPTMITAQEVRDAMKLAPTTGSPATGSIDKQLDDVPTDVNTALSTAHGAGAWGGTGGTGSTSWPITVDDGVNPLDGVEVWVTTDSAGAHIVASGVTDAFGLVDPTPMLDPGTYYVWKQLAGYNFTNPEAITVTE